jgi:hypothetical protein
MNSLEIIASIFLFQDNGTDTTFTTPLLWFGIRAVVDPDAESRERGEEGFSVWRKRVFVLGIGSLWRNSQERTLPWEPIMREVQSGHFERASEGADT